MTQELRIGIAGVALISLISCGRSLVPTVAQVPATTTDPLPDDFYLDGHDFRADKLITTVNSLRQLGKEGALEKITLYAKRSNGAAKRAQTVEILVRLLFVRPAGWFPPALGATDPDTGLEVANRFPYFPIGTSDGIPFLLVTGYKLGGGTGAPWDTIEMCEKLEMVHADLPPVKLDEAASAAENLIGNADFRKLYTNDEGLQRASAFVRWQAKQFQNSQ